MRLLIDGYNLLLSAVGLVANQQVAFAQNRDRMLAELQKRLPARILPETVVVFDSQWASTIGDRIDTLATGLQVEFSIGYVNADERIIELIREHPHPAGYLLVVSSDHQIQRRASARGALFMDSEEFWERLESGTLTGVWSSQRQGGSGDKSAEPEVHDSNPPPPESVDYWLDVFTRRPNDDASER